MVTRGQVVEVLKKVNDPEILQNVWDLGLIYDINVGQPGLVKIKMTMTTPFCPYAPALVDDVRESLKRDLPGIEEVQVEVVWEPAWNIERASVEVREQLGILGTDSTETETNPS